MQGAASPVQSQCRGQPHTSLLMFHDVNEVHFHTTIKVAFMPNNRTPHTSLLVGHNVTENHLHITSKFAFMPGELGDQLPREGVGDGLVGRRVGHPACRAGRNLPPAGRGRRRCGQQSRRGSAAPLGWRWRSSA